jgi:hypothetical protein
MSSLPSTQAGSRAGRLRKQLMHAHNTEGIVNASALFPKGLCRRGALGPGIQGTVRDHVVAKLVKPLFWLARRVSSRTERGASWHGAPDDAKSSGLAWHGCSAAAASNRPLPAARVQHALSAGLFTTQPLAAHDTAALGRRPGLAVAVADAQPMLDAAYCTLPDAVGRADAPIIAP